MLRIEFDYDIMKDTYNILESFTNKFEHNVSYLLDPTLDTKIKTHSRNSILRLITENNKAFNKRNGKLIKEILKFYESVWKVNENKILSKIERIFKTRYFATKTTAYLTLCSRCPYNPKDNSFMISIFAMPTQVIYTIAHELFHLQFYYVFRNLMTKTDTFRDEEFMEDMTAVLDLELADEIYLNEQNSKSNSRLRKDIETLWSKTPDIYYVTSTIYDKLTNSI